MAGFWSGKRVLVTGHTGFKGSWLSEMLLSRGAQVAGLALPPDTRPALFDQLDLAARMDHLAGDIRDPVLVAARLREVQPEVVLHLAAQPLVRRSYRDPLETWSTNVMGTAHVLEAVRALDTPCAVVVVTTDKVYENREWEHPYRETDPLGGHDPYSASKAGTELVAASWRKAFFTAGPVRLATARAGNVIGGGDWSEDRILPDLARAFAAGRALPVRNRHAVRPWQHVLDPLAGYLLLAERLSGPDAARFEDGFNFGPEPADQRSVGDLVQEARRHWAGEWSDATDPAAPHEAGRLALSIERARLMLGWQPRWDFARAVAETVGWYRDVATGADPAARVRDQIAGFGEAE
ncbi:CDP-glucose 4,6-dehydratase [Rhodobacteraceae bacterium HSP-20]|uniref:CDP-glucose 4,6-dehydratase n=1 Tax=Paragemmobacter amnigenus TaxID=2852097 RepID=A0ABS6J386_9RHOB|nr:CDP-glucose 4,6-dehydratase [Rhodobacter amnigenus]MBU9698228.1 CDP-glucose 4,6-dehydratase [Rhodobacter amnigenus]MBV4389455.1 CDP-glucose 4,6-dehydratase [Rhodobacter amnigenus]